MKSEFEDYLIDAKLHIETTGRNDSFSTDHLYPYEPTSYPVLDRLIESGYISREDRVLDYGCGKGRVSIYLNYKIGCKTIGVELMDGFYENAVKNLENYLKHVKAVDNGNIEILHLSAQKYEIPESVNRFFFFNPFSIEVFKSVMGRVVEAYYGKERRMILFFYYPQDEYIAYLSTIDEVMFVDEIDCTDLFEEKDSRNRIMIYEIGTESGGVRYGKI